MSRLSGILGGRMGGNKAGGTAGYTQKSTIGDFVKNNPDFMKLDSSKRNEMLTNLKMQSKAAEMTGSKSNSRFNLPGTGPGQEKELSKSAKDMMDKMIQKQLKKRQKQVVSIRACWLGNGRIGKDGKIYDANNKVVGKIDPETMKISMGMSFMGKYKDDNFTLTKISQKIESMNAPKSSASSSGGIGNFYGTADTTSSSSWW